MAPSAEAPAAAECDTTEADLRSYAPSRESGAALQRIRKADRLVVGVSADTLLMGSRDPETNKIEGFDIDVADRIADEIGVPLQLRVISAADRIPLLESGDIDLVVRNMTINCSRWKEVAFSAEYYHSGQKVLLRSDLAADYSGPADLAGVKVCAPAGTTSIDNIQAKEPEADAEAAENHTGCLVRFQQGEVDAITGDDVVLAGLAAQDPYAVVPNQAAFTDEPYGVAANLDDVDLVRFVNAVLVEMRSEGSWRRSYGRWLEPYLGAPDASNPPTARYGR
ncbi:glutamate ABC transporter substrate-binding protein [Nocardioides sp. YIM 152588]|uniref:glutamate ABC transporter substrate-binding protein n=1 Tax=Nocardioides sp. YIM 152588 TaxID=3158259 RepID=UPI0032E45EAD